MLKSLLSLSLSFVSWFSDVGPSSSGTGVVPWYLTGMPGHPT